MRTHAFTIVARLSLTLPALAGSITTLSLTTSAAMAQGVVKNIDPYVAVVTAEDTELRCGDSNYMYAVARVKAGAMLRIDGEGESYYRVGYPVGGRGIIAADDVTPVDNGASVKLRKPSKLNAFNLTTGARASFMPLLAADLPPDTSLKVIEQIKSDDGKTYYAVEAPQAARAFIIKTAVRKATEEETGKFAGTPAPTPGSPFADPAKTAAKPETKPETKPTVIATTPNIGGRVDPGVPAAPVSETPAGFTPVPPAPEATPAPAPAAPASKPVVNRREQLVAIYERVRQQPSDSAELDEALAEFRGYIATLGDSNTDRATAKSLTRYVQIMDARKKLRDDLRGATETRQTVDTRISEFRKRVIELEGQRVYTVIGRLIPSVVYDGERLPLLYRIQSPEPGSARTLGYLQPDPKLDLTGKLGIVVGIEGEVRFEEALKANIITPRRIDQVSLEPVSGKVVTDETVRTTITTVTPPTPAKPADAEPADTKPAEEKPAPGALPKMKPVGEPA